MSLLRIISLPNNLLAKTFSPARRGTQMDAIQNPTVQRLMRAFTQLRRLEWHQKTFDGCKPSEIRALFCIRKGMSPPHHTMKVSEISKQLCVTAPTVTQIVKSLEARGLVERQTDPNDRRSVDIKLTEEGEIITWEAAVGYANTIQGLIDYLGEKESEQLADLLGKVFLYFYEKSNDSQHSYWNKDEEL